MIAAVVPGSFDPVTNGHLDIIERVAARFDRVLVACLRNPGKHPLFAVEERLALLSEVLGHLGNVEVHSFAGLLVDFCAAHEVGVVIKGLRAAGDFEYELRMAQMNRSIGAVETLFLATSPLHSFVSSSLVKEVARLGGDIDAFVPSVVAAQLRQRVASGTH